MSILNENYLCNLENSMNIFDVLASSYTEICMLIPEKELVNFDEIRAAYITSQIRHYLGEYAIGFDEYMQIITFLVDEFKENEFTYCDHYAIILAIDNCLSDVDLYSSDVYSGMQTISYCLNLNYQITNVFVYPIYKDSVMNSVNYAVKRETGKCFRKNREVDKLELFNIILCEKEMLKGYKIEFRTVSYNKEFKDVVTQNKKLTYAVIPYTSSDLSTWKEIHEKGMVFYLNDLENEKYKSDYLSYIKKILSQNFEIIILPEMILTKGIVEQLSETIRSVKMKKACLIIAGTLSNDMHNHCFVFDHNGNLLIKQHKQTPFDYRGKKEYLEADKTIKILDVIGIGRIAFFICKDMVNLDLNYIVGLLKIDIIIVPAFSPSLDLKSTSEQISREFNLIVIMANCCAALTKKDKTGGLRKIGYVCSPAIEQGAREYHTQYYTGLCKKNCNSCVPRVMEFSINEVMKLGEMVTCSILLRNCSTVCYNKAVKCIQ